jgi:hypothetical protein
VRAAYMVYQGIKHKSLGAVLGGVAGLVSGAGNVAGAFGASAATVNTISNVATAASRLSMAYNAVANKDMSAAMGLLGSFGGQGSTLRTATNFAQQGLGIREAVRSHDALAALGGTLGMAGAATGNEQLAYAGDAVNGVRAVRELDRGNLDAAQSLVGGMTLARSASDEFDAGVRQRLRDAEGANNRTLLNANAGDAQLRAGPAEQDSVVPATRTAFDDDGNLMPGVVDTRAPLAQQLPQLTDALVAQGYSAEEASRLAWRRLAPPTDPFLVQSDSDDRTAAEALADRLGVPRNQIVNAGLLDEAGRSFDVLRGFAEGAGFSILGTGEALMEIARSPRQFVNGVKALLTSPEARAQFGDEIVARVNVDIQMLEDAFNSSDLRGAGQQLGKLTTDLAQIAGGVEALARVGVSAGSAGGRLLLASVDDLAATRLIAGSKGGATSVSQSSTGIQWGKDIAAQGMPWEDYLATKVAAESRLPPNFKTFDFFDRETGVASSAKTLDTTTAAKVANPSQVYTSLKSNVDAVADFERASLSTKTVSADQISQRVLEVAVPANTTSAQWDQIAKAIQYGQSRGVVVKITEIKP